MTKPFLYKLINEKRLSAGEGREKTAEVPWFAITADEFRRGVAIVEARDDCWGNIPKLVEILTPAFKDHGTAVAFMCRYQAISVLLTNKAVLARLGLADGFQSIPECLVDATATSPLRPGKKKNGDWPRFERERFINAVMAHFPASAAPAGRA